MYWFISCVQKKKSIYLDPRLCVGDSRSTLCLATIGSNIWWWLVSDDMLMLPWIKDSFASIKIITSFFLLIKSETQSVISLIIFTRMLIWSMCLSSIISHCCEWTVDTPRWLLGIHGRCTINIFKNVLFLHPCVVYDHQS